MAPSDIQLDVNILVQHYAKTSEELLRQRILAEAKYISLLDDFNELKSDYQNLQIEFDKLTKRNVAVSKTSK